MRRTIQWLPGLLLAAIAVFTLSIAPNDAARWEKLGQRQVNYGLDHDEIVVTAREGAFTGLKLIVRKSGINLHRVVVHYGNGERDELEIRENIAPGGETRVLDLPGRRRVIRTVDFWYDTKNWEGRKAVVELWGRR